GCLDDGRLAGDRHRLLQRRQSELQVSCVLLVDYERDVFDRDRLEAGELRGDVVAPGRKPWDAILPIGFADRGSDGTAVGVLDGDGDAGKHAALGVGDRAGDRCACCLGVRGNGMSQLEGDDERRKLKYASGNDENATKHLYTSIDRN